MIYETNSPTETFELAKKISKKIMPGSIICLDGDLGVGENRIYSGIRRRSWNRREC